MSEKYCRHHHHHRYHKILRRIAIGVGSLILLAAVVFFIIWAILRPSKPSFILMDVTVYTLNVSTAPVNTLSTTMQATVSTRNPNDRIGINNQQLVAYAAYRGEQVTFPTELPPTFQGPHDITVWSPYLYGFSVPLSPELAAALEEDEALGAVLFDIKVDGQIKWKVGSWISGNYHLSVDCPAYIKFGNPNNETVFGPSLKFHFVQDCHVAV